MKRQKILIIKTGYAEVLDYLSDLQNSHVPSLGDILRTTVLLHLYKKDRVTWVTDEKALPLLENNPYIFNLLSYNFTTALRLESEEFDTVINLEKIPGICALSDKIRARRSKYGFTFNTQTGQAEALEKAYEVLTVSADLKDKRENKKTFQELLFKTVEKKWDKEEYILGYKPKIKEEYDVGLNTNVGDKWSIKAWPIKNWDNLEKKLETEGLRITRQDNQDPEVLNNLYRYMDWINSSKIIVSNDSLGLHLGLAFKKYTLGLFGPTPDKEVYFYERGKALLPKPYPDCGFCFRKKCKRKTSCMENISAERVFKEITKIYPKISK